MSIKRLKFFQEMLHKLLLYLGKIQFALPYLYLTNVLMFYNTLSFNEKTDFLK